MKSRFYAVKITVTQVSKILSDADDREQNPAGDYYYKIKANKIAAAIEKGLDIFHMNVPIGCLENFEITTYATRF
jgi:hypothetical protein